MTDLLDQRLVLGVSGVDPGTVDITSVAQDSRQVRPGSLFICLPGVVDDGHRHAAEAVRRGASGVVCERVVDVPRSIPQVRIRPGTARSALAHAAAALYGYPARQLLMAGVTGTNGKTTVSHLLGAALQRSGVPTTVIGTLSGTLTTPESPDLQRLLAEVVHQGQVEGVVPAVSMEVSSHALVQHRVDEVIFDVAVFTNLSPEHLDFHASMEEYWRAKASLFSRERAVRGVVCDEDAWGQRLLSEATIPVVPVGFGSGSDIELQAGRSTFTWRGHRVDIALTGRFNVLNALLAGEAALALGMAPAEIAQGLSEAAPIPGRMEVVAGPQEAHRQPFMVVVDYAHTPAGLEQALSEARRLTGPGGRVSVVFGCGGRRDVAKRPLMGSIAVDLADQVVLTDDNPRGEDPARIVEQILTGVDPGHRGQVEVRHDRRLAIDAALRQAQPGDVVLLAGKGHETYQEGAEGRRPFDDREVAREILGSAPGHVPGQQGDRQVPGQQGDGPCWR